MRRLSMWMRAHPAVGDSLVALLLLLLDSFIFITTKSWAQAPQLPPWFVTIPLDIAMVVPLVFRRGHPLLAAYLILIIGTPHSALGLGMASLITGVIAIYTLVVYTTRKQTGSYVAALAVILSVQLPLQYPDRWLLPTVVTVLLTAFAWVLGEFVGARRAYQRELEARLDLLETERDHNARMAVAQERSRIARELHDVVAHSVSVIVVQADGASYALRSSPEVAERAVRTISETGRAALTELRRLLDLLRNEEGGSAPPVPQPDAEAIAELVERIRSAGLRVCMDLDDDLDELPAGVSLGIYRIVQESLTNTLKHAGEGAHTTVSVRRDDQVVRVEVYDDGAGKARQLVQATETSPAGGDGVIGMRERAHVYGGTLEAGPEPGGGWRVTASLPARADG